MMIERRCVLWYILEHSSTFGYFVFLGNHYYRVLDSKCNYLSLVLRMNIEKLLVLLSRYCCTYTQSLASTFSWVSLPFNYSVSWCLRTHTTLMLVAMGLLCVLHVSSIYVIICWHFIRFTIVTFFYPISFWLLTLMLTLSTKKCVWPCCKSETMPTLPPQHSAWVKMENVSTKT